MSRAFLALTCGFADGSVDSLGHGMPSDALRRRTLSPIRPPTTCGRADVVLATWSAQVRPGDVYEPVGGQPGCFSAGARPPVERNRRIKQPERVSSSGSAGSQPAATRVGRAASMGRIWVPCPGVAAWSGDQPASRKEPGTARRPALQRQDDILIPYGRQRDPGLRAAQRHDRPSRKWCVEVHLHMGLHMVST